jgi:hypothetical protein
MEPSPTLPFLLACKLRQWPLPGWTQASDLHTLPRSVLCSEASFKPFPLAKPLDILLGPEVFWQCVHGYGKCPSRACTSTKCLRNSESGRWSNQSSLHWAGEDSAWPSLSLSQLQLVSFLWSSPSAINLVIVSWELLNLDPGVKI